MLSQILKYVVSSIYIDQVKSASLITATVVETKMFSRKIIWIKALMQHKAVLVRLSCWKEKVSWHSKAVFVLPLMGV